MNDGWFYIQSGGEIDWRGSVCRDDLERIHCRPHWNMKNQGVTASGSKVFCGQGGGGEDGNIIER